MDEGLLRALAAAGLLGAYAALCASAWRTHAARRRADRHEAAALTGGGAAPLLVAYASQTGHAEQLARQSAQALHAAGVRSRVLPLSELSEDLLRRVRRALFVVSTSGEGDPPDNAARFVRSLLPRALALPELHYGLLALGDRRYASFCGFGHALDAWLDRSGARPLFERVEVDRGDAQALAAWRHRLAGLAGADAPSAWSAPSFAPWRVAVRRHLNPGSAGEPIFHLELEPAGAAPLPDWQAGDLVQVQPPGDGEPPRDYSIASLPSAASPSTSKRGSVSITSRSKSRICG